MSVGAGDAAAVLAPVTAPSEGGGGGCSPGGGGGGAADGGGGAYPYMSSKIFRTRETVRGVTNKEKAHTLIIP